MPNGTDLEWSHKRVRPVVRVDDVKPIESEEAAPMKDAETGRFLKGNRAHRRRQLKIRSQGIATMNSAKVPSWMRPHVEQGASYITALLGMLDGKPALCPLAGDCADAHVLYRAYLALALAADDAKTRDGLMAESRSWLKEHRAALATLASLAGGMKLPTPDPHAELAAVANEGRKP
jgi:hypothetical protein